MTTDNRRWRSTRCHLLLHLAFRVFVLQNAQMAFAQATRDSLIEKVIGMAYFGEFTPIHLSPDGADVAYTVRKGAGLVEPGSFVRSGIEWWSVGGDVQVVSAETHAVESISGGKGNSSLPVWSPDGRLLAFLSDRDGTQQAKLWIWDKKIGQLRKVVEVPLRCEQIEWSPDGTNIFTTTIPAGITYEDYLRQASPYDATPAASESKAITEFRSRPSIAESNPEKMEASGPWNLDRYRRDLAAIDVQTGEVKYLVKDERISIFHLSPNGQKLAYTVPLGFEAPGSQQIVYDIEMVDTRTGKKETLARKIRFDYDGAAFSWSEDSAHLAFITATSATAPSALFVATTNPVKSDVPDRLAENLVFPGRNGPPLWDKNNNIIFIQGGSVSRVSTTGEGAKSAKIDNWTIRQVITQGPGEVWQSGNNAAVIAEQEGTKAEGIFLLSLATGESRELNSGAECIACGSQYSLGGAEGRRNEITFIRETSRLSPDLWSLDISTRALAQLTKLSPQLDRDKLGSTRLVDWLGIDGQHLQGALLLPAHYDSEKRYPLVTVVYAGARPSRSLNLFGITGRGPLNPQLLAARGYAVLFPDSPQGVGAPMAEVLKTVIPGINKVIEMGVADPNELGLMGHSNGGYSTVALIAQTKRFKAAVEISGLTDLIGGYGEMNKAGEAYGSNLFEHGQDALGGTPWEVWDKYVENSPVHYLDRITTPLLMAHGEDDIYVAPFLADELFVGLRRLDKDVDFVKYSGEGHDPVSWSYSDQLDLAHRITSWFDSYMVSDVERH